MIGLFPGTVIELRAGRSRKNGLDEYFQDTWQGKIQPDRKVAKSTNGSRKGTEREKQWNCIVQE